MILKIIKYLAVLAVVVSYGALLGSFFLVADALLKDELFQLAWISGVVSVITNAVYGIKTEISDFTLSLYGICGLFWFVPFFDALSPSYGIPSLVGFLIIVIYMHLRPKDGVTVS